MARELLDVYHWVWDYPKKAVFNFLQGVVTTWKTRELARRKGNYHHLLSVIKLFVVFSGSVMYQNTFVE